MDGVLPTEEFMEDELLSLTHEHKVLQHLRHTYCIYRQHINMVFSSHVYLSTLYFVLAASEGKV